MRLLERSRSEEHTSELQSPYELVCRLRIEKRIVLGFPTSCAEGSRMMKRKTSLILRGAPAGVAVTLIATPPRIALDGARAHFFFNDTAPTEIYTLSLHDALPI